MSSIDNSYKNNQKLVKCLYGWNNDIKDGAWSGTHESVNSGSFKIVNNDNDKDNYYIEVVKKEKKDNLVKMIKGMFRGKTKKGNEKGKGKTFKNQSQSQNQSQSKNKKYFLKIKKMLNKPCNQCDGEKITNKEYILKIIRESCVKDGYIGDISSDVEFKDIKGPILKSLSNDIKRMLEKKGDEYKVKNGVTYSYDDDGELIIKDKTSPILPV